MLAALEADGKLFMAVVVVQVVVVLQKLHQLVVAPVVLQIILADHQLVTLEAVGVVAGERLVDQTEGYLGGQEVKLSHLTGEPLHG